MKINDINFEELFTQLESNAWNSGNNTKKYITDGENVLVVEAYTYEPSFESFSATHKIILNGEILHGIRSENVEAYRNEEYDFGRFNNDDEAIKYVKYVFGINEIIIRDEQLAKEDFYIETLKEEIKRLEAENKNIEREKMLSCKMYDELCEIVEKNFIPKSKIETNILALKSGKHFLNIIWKFKSKIQIELLEKLLKK